MKSQAETPDHYIEQLPPERQAAMKKLRKSILENLPAGFQETMSYGMIGYVVPHSVYPKGYHVNPELPLPFINIASQKNFIVLYHMGMYADQKLLDWFTAEYPKHCPTKLNMGKSCIRFKKIDQVPYALINELAGKMSAEDWIALYETSSSR
jgi:uncharacterized protein YdhG (YjbR/CyaY superfamily)